MELLTGKKAVFAQQGGRPVNLAKFMRESLSTVSSLLQDSSLLDHQISSTWPSDSYITFSQIARHCIESEPSQRPSMGQICKRLKLVVDGKQRLCSVCMENPTNSRLQCGHAVLCQPCSNYLFGRGEGCPMCRAPITFVQNGVYSRTFVPNFS